MFYIHVSWTSFLVPVFCFCALFMLSHHVLYDFVCFMVLYVFSALYSTLVGFGRFLNVLYK